MFRSLRVRLPLVFLAGLVLAGVITTLIAVRLFQSLAHDQTLTGLKREAHGVAALYTEAISASYGNKDKTASRRSPPPPFAADTLEQATGDKIYYIGGRNGSSRARRPGLREAAAEDDRLVVGQGAVLRVRAAGDAPRASGGREPDHRSANQTGRRDRRRDAEDGHQPARAGT